MAATYVTTIVRAHAGNVRMASFNGKVLKGSSGNSISVIGTLGSYMVARHGGASRSRRMLMNFLNCLTVESASATYAGHKYPNIHITAVPTAQ